MPGSLLLALMPGCQKEVWFASSAWEDRLALASALGLILRPGDDLGVSLCGEPRRSLASAPTKNGSGSIPPPPPPQSTSSVAFNLLLSQLQTNRITI